MKYLLLTILIGAGLPCKAQFAVVADTDGFVNVRAGQGKNAQVTDTLHNGHPVYCLEPDGNWFNVDYFRDDSLRSGLIHHDRLRLLSSFQKIPLRNTDSGRVCLQNDSIRIVLYLRRFVPARHRLGYDGQQMLTRIDGIGIHGTDGRVPGSEYAEATLQIAGRLIKWPDRALGGLYDPNVELHEAYFDLASGTLYLIGMNGDAAGSYAVLWRFRNGEYLDRTVVLPF